MRRIIENYFCNDNGTALYYVEISGDSTETKPTTGICDGSIFVESDTGKVYFFNETAGDWVEQFTFQQ